MEENLREFACLGNEDGVRNLLQAGVDVNSQHQMNGWTALHWACKRDHSTIVKLLLAHGAEKNLKTEKGEKAIHLTTNSHIQELLGGNAGGDDSPESREDSLPITPSYLKYPPFPYVKGGQSATWKPQANDIFNSVHSHSHQLSNPNELVLKVRLANAFETDYIEVEFDWSQLTYRHLLETCAKELRINPDAVIKIRKLPNTIIRKDKDVHRLHNFQELELVLERQMARGPDQERKSEVTIQSLVL
ncbi:ankyrin repeat domain-containing protein 40-like isoform X2 [Ptychodera flava]|uniref:ankyrin repeat domain-containing protein 40-like isoform X2 n=1 Tax=Ptychodera flava TaxID=63121 RepID=UPI003969CD4D